MHAKEIEYEHYGDEYSDDSNDSRERRRHRNHLYEVEHETEDNECTD